MLQFTFLVINLVDIVACGLYFDRIHCFANPKSTHASGKSVTDRFFDLFVHSPINWNSSIAGTLAAFIIRPTLHPFYFCPKDLAQNFYFEKKESKEILYTSNVTD